jgi:hypothetical protein
MDETLYREWWPLHLRTASGEQLSAEEQARYEAGLHELEASDIKPSLVGLREARAKLDSLRATHAELVTRGQQLDKEIARLEANG